MYFGKECVDLSSSLARGPCISVRGWTRQKFWVELMNFVDLDLCGFRRVHVNRTSLFALISRKRQHGQLNGAKTERRRPHGGYGTQRSALLQQASKSQFGTELVANIANIYIATTIMVSFAVQMTLLVYKH